MRTFCVVRALHVMIILFITTGLRGTPSAPSATPPFVIVKRVGWWFLNLIHAGFPLGVPDTVHSYFFFIAHSSWDHHVVLANIIADWQVRNCQD